MKIMWILLMALSGWAAAANLFPACAEAALPRATPVVSGDFLSVFKLQGNRSHARSETISVTGQSFEQALRLRTEMKPATRYAVQLSAPNSEPVNRGDVLLASFFIRAVESLNESGEAFTEVVFEKGGPPHTKSLESSVLIGSGWQKIHLPFRAEESYGAGEARLHFRLGFDPQVIDLAAVALVNFGPDMNLHDLPRTRVTYSGREADAPWRKTAAERIERHRKADLQVKVTSTGGEPVPNAMVRVRMLRQQFGWGSAVSARLIVNDDHDARKYRETILKLCNTVVFENDLKWQPWENPANREATLHATKWLRDQGIAIRGHCLVWPSWRHMPRDVAGLQDNPAALRERIANRVVETVTGMRGQLVDWDVINEPFDNHDAMDVLGNSVMTDWFKLARQADPDVNLYINDYSILSAGGRDTAHQEHYEKTIRYLLDQGAPLDGIGLQGHFSSDLTPPEKLLQILDRFARFGLPLQVTEHDINVTDEELQADYTRDFLTTLFSHPNVNGILTWGFWEGRHWRPNAAYFRRDWSIKPAGQVWMDLVLHEWRTDAQGPTDPQGNFQTRGFLGDYEITVLSENRIATAKANLSKNGRTVTMVLER
jgi:endo-1,4-beta-xylanase